MNNRGILFTKEDTANEAEVSKILEKKFNCTLHKMPSLHHVDWYGERNGTVVAWFELKCRNVPVTTYDTVFLSHQKYVALQLSSLQGTAKPIFVVKWSCGEIRYIKLSDIPSCQWILGGRKDRNRHGDIEPVIEVPISAMTIV